MMEVFFHPDAEEEFLAGISYYEDCEPGLGLDFANEVHAVIQLIREYPSTWPIIEHNIQRCLVHRFPFGVLYSLEKKHILILAVMHLHREPGYWKHR